MRLTFPGHTQEILIATDQIVEANVLVAAELWYRSLDATELVKACPAVSPPYQVP